MLRDTSHYARPVRAANPGTGSGAVWARPIAALFSQHVLAFLLLYKPVALETFPGGTVRSYTDRM